MDISNIIFTCQTSTWQPKFAFSDNIMDVAKCINYGHEDLGILNDATRQIIERLVVAKKHRFSWQDICDIQQELYDSKRYIIKMEKVRYELLESSNNKNFDMRAECRYVNKLLNLPNLDIPLGLRKRFVKVGTYKPPHNVYLPLLIKHIFPVQATIKPMAVKDCFDGNYTYHLLNWYKIFETIHPLEDLNGRLGGIVVAVLSYFTYGKFLVDRKYNSKKEPIISYLSTSYDITKQDILIKR